jgi:hypothetical protein
MLFATAPTAVFGQEIGQTSSTVSARSRTARMEANTSLQRLLVSVREAEGVPGAEGASSEGEGAAGGPLPREGLGKRPRNFNTRSLFRTGLDIACSDQDECTLRETVTGTEGVGVRMQVAACTRKHESWSGAAPNQVPSTHRSCALP